ncbi:MAG TPA: endo-1,4-beta-xylanase [Kofleriaceae bacterium]|nr:endo-1,4-beta-xylanase [Kofleriaceae bacterium]
MSKQSTFVMLLVMGLGGASLAGLATALADGHHGDPPTPITQRPLRDLAHPAGIRIGTAVDMTALAADQTYRETIEREFSSVTAENVMKWETLEPEPGVFDYQQADALVAFAGAHHMVVRGHVLVWHNQIPAWVNEQDFTPAELRDILREHIIETAHHFRGKIQQWDVLNEAFNEDGTLRDTIWLRALGPDYFADVFRWARMGDPGARLFYNDFNLEFFGPKSDAAFSAVQDLRRRGIPVDGIGFQGHLGAQFGFDTRVQENMQRFANLGLEIAVTEADVRMPLPTDVFKLQSQSQGYHSLLQPCLLTRGCNSFTVWGYTDKYSWVPGFFDGEGAACLLDESFQPKPAYAAVQHDLALAARARH